MITKESILGKKAFFANRRAQQNSMWYIINGVVHIPLPSGEEALIDEVDRELVSRFTWNARPTRSTIYACARVPKEFRDQWNQSYIRLHNLILPPLSGMETDHKDRNGLNCCRYNLRACTESQNNFNRVWPKSKKTNYRGLAPVGRKWLAHIQVNRKQIHLGVFDTEEEAALAYNRAAVHHFGEFSNLNTFEEGH